MKWRKYPPQWAMTCSEATKTRLQRLNYVERFPGVSKALRGGGSCLCSPFVQFVHPCTIDGTTPTNHVQVSTIDGNFAAPSCKAFLQAARGFQENEPICVIPAGGGSRGTGRRRQGGGSGSGSSCVIYAEGIADHTMSHLLPPLQQLRESVLQAAEHPTAAKRKKSIASKQGNELILHDDAELLLLTLFVAIVLTSNSPSRQALWLKGFAKTIEGALLSASSSSSAVGTVGLVRDRMQHFHSKLSQNLSVGLIPPLEALVVAYYMVRTGAMRVQPPTEGEHPASREVGDPSGAGESLALIPLVCHTLSCDVVNNAGADTAAGSKTGKYMYAAAPEALMMPKPNIAMLGAKKSDVREMTALERGGRVLDGGLGVLGGSQGRQGKSKLLRDNMFSAKKKVVPGKTAKNNDEDDDYIVLMSTRSIRMGETLVLEGTAAASGVNTGGRGALTSIPLSNDEELIRLGVL